MNADAFKDIWEARLHTSANELQKASGAGGVLVGIFQAPWAKEGRESSLMGLAGTPDVDVFAIARELRILADTLERKAGQIADARPFVEEFSLPKPARQ